MYICKTIFVSIWKLLKNCSKNNLFFYMCISVMWQHPVISTEYPVTIYSVLTSPFDTKKRYIYIYTQNEPLNLLHRKNILSCVQVALQSQAGADGPPKLYIMDDMALRVSVNMAGYMYNPACWHLPCIGTQTLFVFWRCVQRSLKNLQWSQTNWITVSVKRL